MKRLAAMIAAVAATLAVVAHADQPAPAPPADRDRAAAEAYLVVHAVLLSPRCRNCHPKGDAPLQKDAGVPHAQNISRRSVANGLTCAACHRERNGRWPHSPPGAPHWGLPPAETPMIFEGRTPAQLCAQLKDPAQTRGKDLEALFEHVAHDELVLWGWKPGPGRTVPPVSHARFTAAFRTWIDQGAGCPP